MFYCGLIIALGSSFFLYFKVEQFRHVSELKEFHYDPKKHVDKDQTRVEFSEIIDQYKKEQEDYSLLSRLVNDKDDARTVILGAKSSLLLVLTINCIVCFLFFI